MNNEHEHEDEDDLPKDIGDGSLHDQQIPGTRTNTFVRQDRPYFNRLITLLETVDKDQLVLMVAASVLESNNTLELTNQSRINLKDIVLPLTKEDLAMFYRLTF